MLLKKGLPKVLGFSSEAIHAYRGRSKGSTKQDNTTPVQLPPGTYAPSCYFVEDGSEVPNCIHEDEAVWQLDEMAERLKPPGYEESLDKDNIEEEEGAEQT
ncbi:uncharacterized protein N7483_001007 [Penicillium malachiteum]|uniref:uncharacterized protein n=1 Tax=Penicillium malachiteum TaxID=1324776 RepID=UPI0025488FB9|nr:uncharacterized protein N7483_001007 [Penicillium malachiteum]KAJ5735882.1 hypothetical protein N7483_001007 [Penicillium malachiteum]